MSRQHVVSVEENNLIHNDCSNPQDNDDGSIHNDVEGTLDNSHLLAANNSKMMEAPSIQIDDIVEAWGEDGPLELSFPGFSLKETPDTNQRKGDHYAASSCDDGDNGNKYEQSNTSEVKRKDVRESFVEKQMDLPYLPERFEREQECAERQGGYFDQLNKTRSFPAIGFSNHNQLWVPAVDRNEESERERLVPPEGMHFEQSTLLPPPHPYPVDASSNLLPQPVSLSPSQPKPGVTPFELHPPNTGFAISNRTLEQRQQQQQQSLEVLQPIPPPILIPAPIPQSSFLQGQNIQDVMFLMGDSSSSGDFSSLDGSDKAAYHGPQHKPAKHRIVDLDLAYEKHWTKEMKSYNKRTGGFFPGMVLPNPPESPQQLPFVSFHTEQTRDQRCVTPQRQQRVLNTPPTSPKSPVSPRSQTSQTFHHTFRTNRYSTRRPTPEFVVVPTSGNARVTVTTLGCVRSDDDDDDDEMLIYWRRGFILAVGAVMLLGIITMVSGLLSGTFHDATTLPPTPVSLNRPPIGSSPAQSPTIFQSKEPVPTLPPAFSFPVEVTRAPGIFPPIGEKAVREETPSPTVSSEPTMWRTERPEHIVSRSGSVDEPSAYPTYSPTLGSGPSSEG